MVGVADCRLPKLLCRPADGMFNCKGPLSGTIAPNTLTEVNEEVKLATADQKKKRGSYLSFTPMEKARLVLGTAVSMEFKLLYDNIIAEIRQKTYSWLARQ